MLGRIGLRVRPGRRWRGPVAVAFAAVATVTAGACRAGDDRATAPTRPPTTASMRPASPPATGTVESAEPTDRGAADVWVALESGALVAVDLATGTVTARVDTRGAAHNVATPAVGGAAATVATRGAVVFGDGGPPAVTGGRPHDVKPAGAGRLVVADGGRRRLVVVSAERSVEAVIDLPGVPHDVAVTADGRQAWVTLDAEDGLVVVDLEARRVARTIATGRRPHDLLFSPSGELWVTDLGGGLYPVGPDETVGAELSLGQQAHHLAFSADGAELWVTDSPGRSVSVVDARRRVVSGRVPLAGSPHHVAVVGDRVAVADNTRGLLLVLDRAGRRVVAEIEVGAQPHGVTAAAA